MILKRTDSDDPDFRRLVAELDEYLAEIDGDEHAYYAQFNGIDKIANVVVAYEGDQAVGCGAFKPYSDMVAEIKRMFVHPEHRGKHIGRLILSDLEAWAGKTGFYECILETGHRQAAAVRLYQNCGYTVIPNYDQYAGVESSVCMKKQIVSHQTAEI
jgi:GNAT superfamily N-acetyltransferase